MKHAISQVFEIGCPKWSKIPNSTKSGCPLPIHKFTTLFYTVQIENRVSKVTPIILWPMPCHQCQTVQCKSSKNLDNQRVMSLAETYGLKWGRSKKLYNKARSTQNTTNWDKYRLHQKQLQIRNLGKTLTGRPVSLLEDYSGKSRTSLFGNSSIQKSRNHQLSFP